MAEQIQQRHPGLTISTAFFKSVIFVMAPVPLQVLLLAALPCIVALRCGTFLELFTALQN
jgi:hypothetical protein